MFTFKHLFRFRKNMKKIFVFLWMNLEMFFWLAALVALFFMEPVGEHFSFCPLKNAGFEYCPGCGMGHSIHFALHLDFIKSIVQHPLGIFGLAVIIFRIIELFRLNFKNNYYEQHTATTYSGHRAQ